MRGSATRDPGFQRAEYSYVTAIPETKRKLPISLALSLSLSLSLTFFSPSADF